MRYRPFQVNPWWRRRAMAERTPASLFGLTGIAMRRREPGGVRTWWWLCDTTVQPWRSAARTRARISAVLPTPSPRAT